jgi:hypothetical protein
MDPEKELVEDWRSIDREQDLTHDCAGRRI